MEERKSEELVEVNKRTFTLTELVEYHKQIEEGADLPEEIQELSEVAVQLLKGKIDHAARFKKGLEAHIEALSAQVSYASDLLSKTEALMKQAVEASGKKKLEGDAWSLEVRKNGRGSVVIKDPTKVPDSCKKVYLSVSDKYSEALITFFRGVVLGRPYDGNVTEEEKLKLEKAITVTESKSALEECIKKGEVIEGVEIVKGTHLRVTPGKVKPKMIEG